MAGEFSLLLPSPTCSKVRYTRVPVEQFPLNARSISTRLALLRDIRAGFSKARWFLDYSSGPFCLKNAAGWPSRTCAPLFPLTDNAIDIAFKSATLPVDQIFSSAGAFVWVNKLIIFVTIRKAELPAISVASILRWTRAPACPLFFQHIAIDAGYAAFCLLQVRSAGWNRGLPKNSPESGSCRVRASRISRFSTCLLLI